MNFPSKPYAGPNNSHKIFRKEFVYLNALYYLLISCKDTLHQKLIHDLREQWLAKGIVTHGISKTQFQVVTVYRKDAKKMASNFDGFVKVFNQQVFVSSHRALINYLHDILIELSNSKLIKLKEKDLEQLLDFRLSPKSLLKIINELGVNIASDEVELRQLKRVSATRNIIEHNSRKVNSEFIKLTGYDLNIGDEVPIGSKELGEALAITEHAVQYVNRQVLEKWPQLHTMNQS